MSFLRCACCSGSLKPNPRAVEVKDGQRVATQRFCGRAECQRARKREAIRQWRCDNEGWKTKQRGWMREWSDRHKDCWRRHRASHPEYRRRELERMRRNRAERVAKVTAIREDPVGYLRNIRSLGREGVAKVTGIAAQLDGLVDYLEVRECIAKVVAIGGGGGDG